MVRKHMGYGDSAGEHAQAMPDFYAQHLNPLIPTSTTIAPVLRLTSRWTKKAASHPLTGASRLPPVGTAPCGAVPARGTQPSYPGTHRGRAQRHRGGATHATSQVPALAAVPAHRFRTGERKATGKTCSGNDSWGKPKRPGFPQPGKSRRDSHIPTARLLLSIFPKPIPKGVFLTACTFSLQAHSSIRKDFDGGFGGERDLAPSRRVGRPSAGSRWPARPRV